jgi:uncharacterized protein
VPDLSDVPVVDHHVHPWRDASRHQTVDELAGQVAFSDTAAAHVRVPFLPPAELAPLLRSARDANLGVGYFRRELARFLGVADTWEAVVAARNAAAEADYRAWTGRLFEDARIDALLVDEGGARPPITLAELGHIVPVRLRRVARTDNMIRDLLLEEDSWPRFSQRFVAELEAAIADGAVAFKSVIAYRSGLDVAVVSEADARQSFQVARLQSERAQKPLRDFLLCRTLDVARERGLWVHLHTGVGDPEILYARARPALLYPLLSHPRFRTNRVVLVHGGWPWLDEAAAMVAILPQVYLDVSEGALFGMPNLRQRILEVLEAGPYSKVVYGADGSLPEALWIAARRYKAVLGRVLDELADEGFCTHDEADRIGRMILHDNAARMYGL